MVVSARHQNLGGARVCLNNVASPFIYITVGDQLERSPRLQRCLEAFEDFSVVTTAVREGTAVTVHIANEAGEVLTND